MQPYSSYLICATPRSGSTLLCEALTNTGVAGFPKEYFETLKDTGLPRRPQEYFETWDNSEIAELLGEYSQFNEESVELVKWDGPNYSDYLAKTFEEGTTPNGVFGAKLMWGYFDDFVSNLRLIPDYSNMPAQELLTTVFPTCNIYSSHAVTKFDKQYLCGRLYKHGHGKWRILYINRMHLFLKFIHSYFTSKQLTT